MSLTPKGIQVQYTALELTMLISKATVSECPPSQASISGVLPRLLGLFTQCWGCMRLEWPAVPGCRSAWLTRCWCRACKTWVLPRAAASCQAVLLSWQKPRCWMTSASADRSCWRAATSPSLAACRNKVPLKCKQLIALPMTAGCRERIEKPATRPVQATRGFQL